MINYICSIT